MKTNLYLILILTILISSCSNLLNEKIDSQTLEANVQKIKEKYPDLDSTKIDLLDNLIAINKGRDAFISSIDVENKGESSIEKYIVDEDKFTEIKDNIFNYFKAQEITFKKLFEEYDTVKMINDKYDNQNQELYKEIDAYCTTKQKEIDEKEKNAEEIKTKLNQMVDLKIISIKETEYGYRDVIEVKIQMINKTSKPVEALSFNLEITDKLGNKLATLGCRTNDRFVKSDVGNWTYDRWDHDDIYKALKNTKISHITTKQEITKINLGGELISAYGDLEALFTINYKYSTPDKLTGHCPYLNEDDELSKKLDAIEKSKEKEIEKSTPVLNKYSEMTSKFLDFSSIFDY